MKETEKTKVVATRVTVSLAELIAAECDDDEYVNTADFIRDAIREKLQNRPRPKSKKFQRPRGGKQE